MKSDFKLVGLSKTKSMTCEPLDKEEPFWPKCGLTQDRFDALEKKVESGSVGGTMDRALSIITRIATAGVAISAFGGVIVAIVHFLDKVK